jgi:hypothetical protein
MQETAKVPEIGGDSIDGDKDLSAVVVKRSA